MKFFIKSLLLTVLLAIAFSQTKAQTFTYAYIQIAHNCADTTLDTLDIYINGAVLDSNVVYHSATGMFPYRTDTTLSIGVSYKHSAGIPQYVCLNNFTVPNQFHRYVFLISGVNSSSYTPDSAVTIKEIADVDSAVNDTSHLVMRFFGGVTDLPSVDIKELNSGAVYVNNLSYGTSTADVTVRHTVYEFQVTDHNTAQNYGTYYADLSGLASQSVIVLCSGFLNQAANDSGPALGLYVLENTGAVLTLPLETTGFQLLHNCADPAADSLDVYVNGELIFHNLAFRTATPGILFKAHATYNIGIAKKNSASVTDTIWQHTFDFPRDTFFIATATGLLSQNGFAPNPRGLSTAFDVLLKVPAEFGASALNYFDFFMINGVTDAPALNLVPANGPLLLSNVEYGQQTGYVSLPAEFYTLNVQDTTGNILASGFANFISFPSQSAVLLTSGFLNPASNNNGRSLGLYMVPITGGPFIPLFNALSVTKIANPLGLLVSPNPTSGQMHIVFDLDIPEAVSLRLTDLNGRSIQTIAGNAILSGSQNMDVDVSNLSSGIYFIRLATAAGTVNCKFAVAR
jgi:Secretion system C-terminal sorting domain